MRTGDITSGLDLLGRAQSGGLSKLVWVLKDGHGIIVNIHRIPGHSGIPGNKEAHCQANKV